MTKTKTITLQKQEIPQNISGFKYVVTSSIKLVDKFKDEYRKLSTLDYEMLKQKIIEYGIITPLIVSKNMVLIDGHNRYYIAVELGIEVPVVVLDGVSNKAQEEAAIALNLLRRQLKPLERREYQIRLFPHLLTKDVVKATGKAKKGLDEELAQKLGIDMKQFKADRAIIRKAQKLSMAERGSIIPNKEELRRAAAPTTSNLESMKATTAGFSKTKMKETATIMNKMAGAISKKGKLQMTIENVVILQPAAQKLLVAINKRIEEQ